MIRCLVLFLCFSTLLHAATIGEYWTNKKGVDAFQDGDYQQAMEHFSKVLSSGHELPEVYNNIGETYYETGATDQAIKAYEESLQLLKGPHRRDVLFNLGNAHMKNQAFDKAVTAYKDSLREDPSFLPAKQNLEYAMQLLQQQRQQQQQDNKQNKNDDKKESKQQQQPQKQDQSDKDKQQEQDSNASEQQDGQQGENHSMENTDKDPQQELTKQMLEFLTQKELEAKEKYKKKVVREATVEKDW